MSKLKKKILGFFGEKIFQHARVSSVEAVSEHFRLICIESPSFAKLEWKPGEKIQIDVGDWNVRTYTPISLNPTLSQVTLLVFLHGNGPGSTWARDLKKGDYCQVFGPRSSVSVSAESHPRIVMGDETSIALAIGLKRYYGSTSKLSMVFEVSSIEEVKSVCERFDILEETTLIDKNASNTAWPATIRKFEYKWGASVKKQLLLTGNAKSIQSIRKVFREVQLMTAEMTTKPYWSPGKEGMD